MAKITDRELHDLSESIWSVISELADVSPVDKENLQKRNRIAGKLGKIYQKVIVLKHKAR